ncbi:hypothetical protein L6452_17515 [Arctium lappa]|uniref:Uncharacterized protein n=1 Tax=Arctium lappa TaxID=4217 RepID=A0ACB9C3S2_ARCLA|nr:hypothetical protein L6452_17515 [Arctium lappa]
MCRWFADNAKVEKLIYWFDFWREIGWVAVGVMGRGSISTLGGGGVAKYVDGEGEAVEVPVVEGDFLGLRNR